MSKNKIKVYLSKSMAGSLLPIPQVKEILSRMPDIEVVEFTGGNYTHAQMLECDILLVLPPEKISVRNGNYDYSVGRGQFEQVREFAKQKQHSIVVLTGIHSNDKKELSLSGDSFFKLRLIEENWQTKYALIETEDDPSPLTDYDDCFETTPVVNLLLDYDWGGALEGLKPKLPEPISIKDVISNNPSAFGAHVHKMLEQRLVEPNYSSIPTIQPLLICVKLFR